jgi:hypothetical protein
MLNRTSPEFWVEDVARELSSDKRPLAPPDNLGRTAARIWRAYNGSHDAREFAAVLNDQGISLAAVTREEAAKSHRESAFAREIGRFAPTYREGEILAVTERAHVYRLTERNTGDDRAGVERFLKKLDRTQLPGIEATKQVMHDRAAQREATSELLSILSPVKPREKSSLPSPGHAPSIAQERDAPAVLGKTAERTLGGVLDVVGNVFESLLAPPLTPEQKREGELSQAERAADTAHNTQYLADLETARQQQEQEQEAARQRQRASGRDR